MTAWRKAARSHRHRLRASARALPAMMAAAVLAIALPAPGRGLAAGLDAMGLLWMPEGAAPPVPTPVVIALHDSPGIGPRGWHYGDQITAAGIAVLHVELPEVSGDGGGAAPATDAAAAASARLAMAMDLLAADPRFAGAPAGLLAFGSAGQVALLAAADPAHGERLAGLALLYPGCAALAAGTAERLRPRSPVLLLHGDADPANLPADCGALASRIARSAPVQRRQYAGAGYAWDLPPHGPLEAVKLPWPGRPGRLLEVRHAPGTVELAATQIAAFFAASFATHRQ